MPRMGRQSIMRHHAHTHSQFHDNSRQFATKWHVLDGRRNLENMRNPRQTVTRAQDQTGDPEAVRRQHYLLCHNATH